MTDQGEDGRAANRPWVVVGLVVMVLSVITLLVAVAPAQFEDGERSVTYDCGSLVAPDTPHGPPSARSGCDDTRSSGLVLVLVLGALATAGALVGWFVVRKRRQSTRGPNQWDLSSIDFDETL
jgi:hypothetical protein